MTPPVEAGQAGPLDGTASTAQSLSEATGLAISPLLVLAGQGAYRYWASTPTARVGLPWYAHLQFWVPAFILISLVLFKEVILGRFLVLKKPLDELQLLENTISGILACPVAVAGLAAVLKPRLSSAVVESTHLLLPVAHAASAGAGMTASVVGGLSSVVSTAISFVIFSLLWMTSQALNVLLLLSPFGVVDNVVKLLRLILLGTVVVLTWVAPTVGIALCLLLMVISLRLAGWSSRLLIFGGVFSLDVLCSRAAGPSTSGVRAFSWQHHETVPPRTYGILRRGSQDLEFTYRRSLGVGKRIVAIPQANLQLRAEVVGPVVVNVGCPGQDETAHVLFRLPPRYRAREAAVAAGLGGMRVGQTPVVAGYRAFRRWCKGITRKRKISADGAVTADEEALATRRDQQS